jgi:cystathionine gamma-synthase
MPDLESGRDRGGSNRSRHEPGSETTLSDETLLASAGLSESEDDSQEAIVLPVYASSIFKGEDSDHRYGRRENPNRRSLERIVASLEGGQTAVAFPSGMAAIYCVLEAVGLPHVILPFNVYGGLYELLSCSPLESTRTFEFLTITDAKAVRDALEKGPAIIWLESPSNPLLEVFDISRIAMEVHDGGGKVVVDNTFATPLGQQPLLLGADAVIHSTTKYIGGHSDLIGGIAVASDDIVNERLRYLQQVAGLIPSPFDCWLAARGIRTLAVRLARQGDSADYLARWLMKRLGSRNVYYPAANPEAQRLRASGVLGTFGGVVSVDLGSESRAKALMDRLRLFRLGASVGGVESTVSHPASMSHRILAADGLSTIPAGLVRLSIGLENPKDLVRDLEEAMADISQIR